jgi:glycosyltransferase involved in cell wall biosynthesis
MKLLFVVNNPDFFLSHRLGIGRAARDRGYDVHVAVPDGPGAREIEAHGFRFHPVQMTRSGGWLWKELRTIASLLSLYSALRPDIVHHVTIKPVLYGSLAARIARVPAVINAMSGLGYVFLATGWKAALVRRAVIAAYRFAFVHPNLRVIFQNPDDRALFLEGRVVGEDRCVLIKGAGVDVDAYSPPAVRAAGPPLVVLPARMLWDKGIREFAEAASILRRRGVNARFALVGGTDSGNPASADVEWLRRVQEEGAVEWWGHRSDMPVVLASAHIACLPSYREGLPKSLIEAASCGLPLVAADAPGCREIVWHGENGLLARPRDAESLAAALETLIQDEGLRHRMGDAGRRMVIREFSLDHVVRKTLSLYAQVREGAPGPGREESKVQVKVKEASA